jgi:hypothetical protein
VSHYGRYIVLVNFVGTIYFEKSKKYIYIKIPLCPSIFSQKLSMGLCTYKHRERGDTA